jgi:hypothetical protein
MQSCSNTVHLLNESSDMRVLNWPNFNWWRQILPKGIQSIDNVVENGSIGIDNIGLVIESVGEVIESVGDRRQLDL